MGRQGNELWTLRWGQRLSQGLTSLVWVFPRRHCFRKGVDSTQSSRRSEQDSKVSLRSERVHPAGSLVCDVWDLRES